MYALIECGDRYAIERERSGAEGMRGGWDGRREGETYI
jgi:hypothetical protein